MRLARLDLIAYGSFTDRTLELAAPGVVDLVHGPNEAGKSTARRAIAGVLFGIRKPLSPDAYLHSNASLRIGAVV